MPYSKKISRFRGFLLAKIDQFLSEGGKLESGIWGLWEDGAPICCALNAPYYLGDEKIETFAHSLFELGRFFRSRGFDFQSGILNGFMVGFDGGTLAGEMGDGEKKEMFLLGREMREKFLTEEMDENE